MPKLLQYGLRLTYYNELASVDVCPVNYSEELYRYRTPFNQSIAINQSTYCCFIPIRRYNFSLCTNIQSAKGHQIWNCSHPPTNTSRTTKVIQEGRDVLFEKIQIKAVIWTDKRPEWLNRLGPLSHDSQNMSDLAN